MPEKKFIPVPVSRFLNNLGDRLKAVIGLNNEQQRALSYFERAQSLAQDEGKTYIPSEIAVWQLNDKQIIIFEQPDKNNPAKIVVLKQDRAGSTFQTDGVLGCGVLTANVGAEGKIMIHSLSPTALNHLLNLVDKTAQKMGLNYSDMTLFINPDSQIIENDVTYESVVSGRCSVLHVGYTDVIEI